MAWTTPLTAVSNATLTAAQWNASVRDDLLMTAPALATTSGGLIVATGTNAIAQRIPVSGAQNGGETTTSTTYTGTLSGGAGTAGPSATVTTGAKAFIAFHSRLSTSVGGTNVWVAVATSGAGAIPAVDNRALSVDVTGQIFIGSSYIEHGVTPGANTFQMQYRVSGGTGTFASRSIDILAL